MGHPSVFAIPTAADAIALEWAVYWRGPRTDPAALARIACARLGRPAAGPAFDLLVEAIASDIADPRMGPAEAARRLGGRLGL